MPAKINLLNQQFGKLLVLEETQERRNKSILWLCECECKTKIKYSTKELRNDGIQMCPKCGNSRNPQMNIKEYLIGKTFGLLTVIEKTDESNSEGILYKCKCSCDKKTIIYKSRKSLSHNENISCGCNRLKYKVGDIINNRKIISTSGVKTSNGRHYYICECLLCKKIYEALGQTLEKTIGCGCQNSKGEFYIIQLLIANNIKFTTQYTFSDLPRKKFDFALLTDNNQPYRVIEFDGEQHFSNNIKNSGWNTFEHYQKVQNSDTIKNQYLEEKDIDLVRIPYWKRNSLTIDMLLSNQYLVQEKINQNLGGKEI